MFVWCNISVGILEMIPVRDLTYTFSYWIFAWFLFYEFGWTSYNPKIFILLAGVENILLLFLMIYFKNSWKYILFFIFINFFIKIIPIIVLWDSVNKWKDVYFGIGLFVVYNGWLLLNGTNVFTISENGFKKIRENKPSSPLVKYVFS